MTRAAQILLVGCLMLAACSDPPALTVNVATGLVPGPEFALIQTELIENGAPLDTARSLASVETVAAFGQSFSRGRRVATFPDLSDGPQTVRVRLFRPDGTLLIQHRTRVNVAGAFVLTVHLTRDCVGVMCPSAGGSPAFSECLAGRCVSPDCVAPDAALCPDILFCNSASDCGATSECAQQTCTDGICEPEAMSDFCAPTEWCDPDPDGGCLPGLPMDGGVVIPPDDGVDGGGLDAGVDGSVECGRTCTPEGSPCVAGFWDCTASTPTCARLGQRTPGTSCASGSVCDSTGACTECRDGVACRVGCASGHVSCALGFEDCVLDTPTTNVAPATTCAADVQCVGTDSCGTGNICSPDGTCGPCSNGAACINGCENGAVDCSLGGVCVSDGTARPTGSSCGTNLHCTAERECVSCVEFDPCESTDPCRSTRVSCALGTPTCVYAGSLLGVGEACAEDSVCDFSATCQHCVVGETCYEASGCRFGAVDNCAGGPACVITTSAEPGVACDGGVCNGYASCYAPLVADDIELGAAFACALLSDATVTCWGDNSSGQLGRGTFDFMTPDLLTKRDVGLTDVVQVSTGGYHTCAITGTGDLWCWGNNGNGGLGIGSRDATATPMRVALPRAARAVAAGYDHTCVILDDATVFCWGYGPYIGTGDGMTSLSPAQVPGITNAVQLAVGGTSTCARLSTGHIKCWGFNDGGQLGDAMPITADPYASFSPIDVLTIDDAIDVSMGGSWACAVRGTGEVWCWGQGGPLLFLDSAVPDNGAPPTQITLPFADVVDVVAGYSRICVLRAGGGLYCWGDNSSGQAGVGTFDFVTEPTSILFISDVAQQTFGLGYSTCVRRLSGQILCFGDNSYGQLGDGSYNYYASPTVVRAL